MSRHKAVNLYGDQIDSWESARDMAAEDLDTEEPSDGEVLRVLADAYIGAL